MSCTRKRKHFLKTTCHISSIQTNVYSVVIGICLFFVINNHLRHTSNNHICRLLTNAGHACFLKRLITKTCHALWCCYCSHCSVLQKQNCVLLVWGCIWWSVHETIRIYHRHHNIVLVLHFVGSVLDVIRVLAMCKLCLVFCSLI